MPQTNEALGNVLLNPVTQEPIPLAMQRMELKGDLGPTGGVLTVTHSFKCEGDKPMEAIYVFQLPRGGALRRFVIKGENFEAESRLSPRAEAKKEYEAGVQDGHLSSLAETSLDGVVTLAVGQVQPKETVTIALEVVSGVDATDKGYRFRFPFTLAPNYHSSARISSTGDGMVVEADSKVFGDLILPEWKNDASGLHQVGFRMKVRSVGPVNVVASPSHNISVQPNDDGSMDVWLAGFGEKPNRDLVLDIRSKEATSVVFADSSLLNQAPKVTTLPDGHPRWTAMIPSSVVPMMTNQARKVCFVLDHSGSMNGPRLDQAKIALKACLSALTPSDEFGLVRFEDQSEAFHDKMAPASDANRGRANKWLDRTQPAGGTELAAALGMAVEVLGCPGYDIFLITDGEVGETGPIIEQAAACGSRIHVLGIGDAAQDRFMSSLARRTEGIQKMVNVGEDVAMSALGLFNAVRQPRQVNVKAVVEMETKITQVHNIGTVWDGHTIVITDDGTSVDLPKKVGLTWDGGNTVVDTSFLRLAVPDDALALTWAGGRVEDLESALDMSKSGPARKSVELELKKLSTEYGLASRVMSLCAVVKRVGDQAGETPEQKIVAVGLPSDMQGEQRTAGNICIPTTRRMVAGSYTKSFAPGASLSYASFGPGSGSWTRGLSSGTKCCSFDGSEILYEASADSSDHDCVFLSDSSAAGQEYSCNEINVISGLSGHGITMSLLSLLGTLEADGGLPGSDMASRVAKTALLALAVMGHMHGSGDSTFAAHLTRMADFLEKHPLVEPDLIPELLTILRGTPIQVNGQIVPFLLDTGWNSGDATDLRLKTWSEIRTALRV